MIPQNTFFALGSLLRSFLGPATTLMRTSALVHIELDNVTWVSFPGLSFHSSSLTLLFSLSKSRVMTKTLASLDLLASQCGPRRSQPLRLKMSENLVQNA